MNLFLRILLTIYAFCLTLLSILAITVIFWNGLLDSIYISLKESVFKSTTATVIMFAIALVFFGLSLTFLFSGYGRSKAKRAVSKFTNVGEIKISLNSIENIALAASRKLIGVRETKAYVERLDDAVVITIKAVVMPDINIPSLSEDIQVKVKNSIEDCAGIKVNEVKVLVDNIYTGYKARVE